MKLQSILVILVALVLAVPALAQQPAATGDSAQTRASATWEALSPLVGPHTAALSAAGVEEVVARTGKNRRDIQVLTRWGPAYFPWPKGVTPVTFYIYVKAPNAFDVTADGFKEANKARYAAAFDAVLPQAVSSANALRAQATRPKK
jgi:hypothetical protein